MKRRPVLAGLGAMALAGCRATPLTGGSSLKVGILHSLTGTMALSETPVQESTLMALQELNARGGLLGRRIEPVIADGRSDWSVFAAEAERLITQEKVCTVFGCWTSASRKTVLSVFERNDHLLIYPVQYEGLEMSPNVVYTGAAPNQQIIPAVTWSSDHLGKRMFLVGSDYVFPRTANALMRSQIEALGAEVVGEEYLLLGTREVQPVVDKIAAARPQVILNTINGDTNLAFFRALRAAGMTPDRCPTMSFSIGEHELASLNPDEMAGDYCTWNYFQSLPGEDNAGFVQRFRQAYGPRRVTDDPIEAGYFGVYLWAQAVRDAGSADARSIRRAIKRQTFEAPEGIVYVDPESQHTWKMVRVGRIRGDGQFDVVWSSQRPVRPEPFPPYRSRQEWEAFLRDLYQGWGGHWANPGARPSRGSHP